MAENLQRSISTRRSSAQKLSKLTMSRGYYDTFCLAPRESPTQEEIEEEGKQLFENFVQQQVIVAENQHVLQVHEDISSVISTPKGYQNPVWAKAGRELRMMADEFAQTKERQGIQRRAQQVGEDVGEGQFRDLLRELFFEGKITKERILVLFFFCADVAVLSLKKSIELFNRFWRWSLGFITENVCTWVRNHGGWGAVLGESLAAVKVVLIFGAIALISYGAMNYLKS